MLRAVRQSCPREPSAPGSRPRPHQAWQRGAVRAARRTACLVAVAVALAGAAAAQEAAGHHYEMRTPTRDGTGRFYMGREIAQVMGHLAAGWLERPEREREERTDLLLAALRLEPTDVVADIGAGTGYFSFPMAARVPRGRVFAVDIQPEMLAIVEQRRRAAGIDNVEARLGSITDPGLAAASVDLMLLVDAYHEFSHPREMGESMVRALRPGARLVLVEYRAEDAAVPIKPLHRMSEAQARREMAAIGLEWVETRDALPWQHILVFRKPAP
jgi:FkbM family methyltransferase